MTSQLYKDGLASVEKALNLAVGSYATVDRLETESIIGGSTIGILNSYLMSDGYPLSISPMYFNHNGSKIPEFSKIWDTEITTNDQYAFLLLSQDSSVDDMKFNYGYIKKKNVVSVNGKPEVGLYNVNVLNHRIIGFFMFSNFLTGEYITTLAPTYTYIDFDNTTNVINKTLSEWNTFFNCNFVSVFSVGARVFLFGGTSLTLPVNFHTLSDKIVGFFSNAFANYEDGCFDNLPMFYDATLLSCSKLGSTVGDNGVFAGNTAMQTLTVPAALETCNAGQPDGDIQYAIANNPSLTVSYV